MSQRPAIAIRRRRNSQDGFALLLVFLMAASIALMLYMQMPRVAFESQRMKEQRLVDHGKQYIRGIQLYVAKWKTYPQSMEQLEKTNNERYLRRRYKDPMTGKDEWRLLHINAAGVLTDSLIQKNDLEKKETFQNNFITESKPMGSAAGGPEESGVNVGLRKRQSEEAQAGGQGLPPLPGTTATGQPPTPSSQLGQGPQVPQPGEPGGPALPAGADANGTLQAPDNSNPQPNPNTVGPIVSNPQSANNPQAPNSPPGPPPPPGFPTQQQPGPQSNPGLDTVKNLLMTPRPQGQPGMQVPGAPGLNVGGGIAGVASNSKVDSIMIYAERQKYNEWEFVYDIKNDKRLQQQLQGMNQQNQNPNQPGQNPLRQGQPGTPPNPPTPPQPPR